MFFLLFVLCLHQPAKSLSLSLGFKKPNKGIKSMRGISHTSLKTSVVAAKQQGKVDL